MTEQKGRSFKDLLTTGQVQAMPVKLTQPEKQAMFQNGTVFDIHGVEEFQKDNIHTFNLSITIDGKPYIMGMSANATRSHTMRDLAMALADGPITGCRLSLLSGEGAFAAYGIEPAE